MNVMYTYDDIMIRLTEFSKIYSDILTLETIGISHDLRRIPMVSIGKGEKYLICSGGVHGRESINPPALLHLIEEYCELIAKGRKLEGIYDISKLLKQYTIAVIPILNPDGYTIALSGYEGIRSTKLRKLIKSMNIPHAEWKFNGRGIDINRNFPCESYVPVNPEDYPESENETKALIHQFNQKKTAAYLDFHSRGRIIYYYRNAMSDDYNRRSYKIALEMQKANGYALGTAEEEFLAAASGGNTVNYYSEMIQKPALTVETVEDEAQFPMSVGYQEEVVKDIRLLPFITLEVLEDL
jgi:g-D-glutamyl-meso-diaminopimelate peptidase